MDEQIPSEQDNDKPAQPIKPAGSATYADIVRGTKSKTTQNR